MERIFIWPYVFCSSKLWWEILFKNIAYRLLWAEIILQIYTLTKTWSIPLFKDMYHACGLLEDDREWSLCLREATEVQSGTLLYHLFSRCSYFVNLTLLKIYGTGSTTWYVMTSFFPFQTLQLIIFMTTAFSYSTIFLESWATLWISFQTYLCFAKTGHISITIFSFQNNSCTTSMQNYKASNNLWKLFKPFLNRYYTIHIYDTCTLNVLT